LFRMLDNAPGRQVAYYHPGLCTMEAIGALTSLARQTTKLLGLAVGYGLEREICEAYAFIMQNYEPDDALYLFGFSRGAYTVRAVASLLHPDDAEAWAAALESLQRPPHRSTLEHRWRTPQGWRWIAWDLSAQHGADGDVVALKATGSDVTKRRLAEEQFLRLSCAVEQSPVAILITDPQGRVQYVNRKFTESSGHSMEDILDRNLDPLRAGHADDEAYERFWQTRGGSSRRAPWRGTSAAASSARCANARRRRCARGEEWRRAGSG